MHIQKKQSTQHRGIRIYLAATVCSLALLVQSPNLAVAQVVGGQKNASYQPNNKQDNPVNLSADQLFHDDETQTITATGNVELIQNDQILHAERIIYYLDTDRVMAYGNVSILDKEGNVHFADFIELANQMKNGFAKGLMSQLKDGSRFKAQYAERKNATLMMMKDASYTPCKVCKENPDKEPLWSIKAAEVTHNEETGDVSYKNARLDFFGVPLAYTPYFKHADAKATQKSGFLRPKAGWTSLLGGYVDTSYYYNIDDSKDMTLNIQPTTQQGILTKAQYRQHFKKGRLNLNVSGAFGSNRTEEDDRIEEDVTRGHIFADGIYHINNKWRAGFNWEQATDKEYLRLYEISKKDVLETEGFLERFSGRNYSSIRALHFQDVRTGPRPEQPDVLPIIEHTMYSEPNQLLHGTGSLDASLLSLYRGSDEQDMTRASLGLGWEKRFVSHSGLTTTFETQARGDFYYVTDRVEALADPNLDADYIEQRLTPQAQITASFPMAKRGSDYHITIEPIASLSATAEFNSNQDDIPNEDSQDVQLDITNLFNINRFPGTDRQEDGARTTVGLKTGYFTDDGRSASLFVGQSYRFKDDNLFPVGSGLENNRSDFVGKIRFDLSENLDVDYTFQLDQENWASRRHELYASGGVGRFRLNTRYLYAAALPDSGFDESREELNFGTSIKLNENWDINANTLTDLGEEPGLRKASAGLYYNDDCFTFALLGARNLVNRTSGENETTLLMRIGLKNIGQISTPQILLQSEVQE